VSHAVVADDISKVFRISNDPVRSMKERLVGLGRRRYTDFAALSPMSFAIEQGETVGILGHNGSGKSTLLKCIAGILRPTTGTVAVRGRLASLLELGAGFHPELSGRENVYINAAFLGISRREIEARFDDIIEFAELGRFIDEPVKHYSSGMYVRLGFAVAVNVDPDVLLVDEVLAVGDESFATKCLDRVKEFQAEGRTIVVVTHAADIVRQVCQRALVLDHGRLVADERPNDAIRIFREHLHGALTDDSSNVVGPVQLAAVTIANRDGGAVLSVTVASDADVDHVGVGVEVADASGRLGYRIDGAALGLSTHLASGRTTFDIGMSSSTLLGGNYPVTVRLTDAASGRLLAWHDLRTGITVPSRNPAAGVVDGIVDLAAALQVGSHPVDGAAQAIVE
jgi:ABC-2 type transport system ATP-binding protein